MAKKYRVFIVQTMQPLTVEADSEREAEKYARGALCVGTAVYKVRGFTSLLWG